MVGCAGIITITLLDDELDELLEEDELLSEEEDELIHDEELLKLDDELLDTDEELLLSKDELLELELLKLELLTDTVLLEDELSWLLELDDKILEELEEISELNELAELEMLEELGLVAAEDDGCELDTWLTLLSLLIDSRLLELSLLKILELLIATELLKLLDDDGMMIDEELALANGKLLLELLPGTLAKLLEPGA